jgi:hypothetical protein
VFKKIYKILSSLLRRKSKAHPINAIAAIRDGAEVLKIKGRRFVRMTDWTPVFPETECGTCCSGCGTRGARCGVSLCGYCSTNQCYFVEAPPA